ncbi:MAG: asparagine synthase (glutamine-hydrolyzing) [Acidobacteria bacterium]|nr:asparagine synthase (glutamine-hydrolyzing) [Acidobacteriota bacterium]
MCGIVGWLGPAGGDAATLHAAVDNMASALVHRGPDDDGRWLDVQAGIALGFRRLSILDLTQAGHQPMLSADGRYVCVFNGEIYNHRELRTELERRGARFRGASDTEVIVEAAAAFGGATAVRRLWGMFALGIWDRLDGSLLLARDRLGKKPLHVTRLNEAGWLFASELKAFRQVDCFRPEIDPTAVAAYLRFGYVPAPLTIFRNTWKLEPGTFSVFRFDRPVRTERYWSPCDLARATRSEPVDVLVSELDSLLRDAVSRRMIADVPVGSFLSGGIDSAAVTALMQRQSVRPVRTFSIGFHNHEYDEAAAAAAVARHLGTEHVDFHLSADDARAMIPDLAEIYDEPFADSSQIPTLLISRLARRSVTVALSGDGGDEVFAGYRRHELARTLWAAARRAPRAVRQSVGALLTSVPVSWWDSAFAVAKPLVPARLRHRSFGEGVHKAGAVCSLAESADELYWNLVSIWRDPGLLFSGGGDGRVRWESACLDAEIPEFGDRMTLYDLVTYLPDGILVKIDRASMAASLEMRSPLLDHRIVEWASSLPFGLKIRGGATKWILRQVLYRYVPPPLVDRPKTGFSVPLEHWLRGPLRDWAEHLLRPDRIEAAGLRPPPVRRAWRRHLAGMPEQHRIWAVLMLMQWRQRWA